MYYVTLWILYLLEDACTEESRMRTCSMTFILGPRGHPHNFVYAETESSRVRGVSVSGFCEAETTIQVAGCSVPMNLYSGRSTTRTSPISPQIQMGGFGDSVVRPFAVPRVYLA